MRQFIGIFVLLTGYAIGSIASPPEIVSSRPAFWAVNVDPTTQKTLSLTFDQAMRADFWDWYGRGVLIPPLGPQTTLSPDQTTCTVATSLQAGRVYVCGLNERGLRGVGFQNVKGVSLSPKFLVFQTAGSPKPEDGPPRALGTLPASGAQDVNPATAKAITVTFDRAMDPKKHGLHLFEEKKPVDLKSVTFTYSADGKTFILNYPLKPSTRYEVVMNSTEDIGFAATNRVPLWPVSFAFTTGQPH